MRCAPRASNGPDHLGLCAPAGHGQGLREVPAVAQTSGPTPSPIAIPSHQASLRHPAPTAPPRPPCRDCSLQKTQAACQAMEYMCTWQVPSPPLLRAAIIRCAALCLRSPLPLHSAVLPRCTTAVVVPAHCPRSMDSVASTCQAGKCSSGRGGGGVPHHRSGGSMCNWTKQMGTMQVRGKQLFWIHLSAEAWAAGMPASSSSSSSSSSCVLVLLVLLVPLRPPPPTPSSVAAV